jgi:hypothetical protein
VRHQRCSHCGGINSAVSPTCNLNLPALQVWRLSGSSQAARDLQMASMQHVRSAQACSAAICVVHNRRVLVSYLRLRRHSPHQDDDPGVCARRARRRHHRQPRPCRLAPPDPGEACTVHTSTDHMCFAVRRSLYSSKRAGVNCAVLEGCAYVTHVVETRCRVCAVCATHAAADHARVIHTSADKVALATGAAHVLARARARVCRASGGRTFPLCLRAGEPPH